MAVCSTMASQFSNDGKYFAQISPDGKLKIWETATSTFEQEFTPDYHLTSPCTCLHFIQQGSQANQNHSPRKKKRRESLDATIVALGTSSGLLLLYSISKGDLDFTIDSETNQSINSISWNDGNILYSAIDQNIVSWNLDKKTIKSKWKAGNEKLSSILIVPDSNKILTASRNIKLWDVNTKEVIKTFTGHSNEVCVLQYVSPRNNTDAYIISGSKGDRILSVWNLSKLSKDKNAVASFLMEDVPANISIITIDGMSSLAVVTRSGVAHFYQHTLNGKCGKPLKPKTTIQVASDVTQTNTLIAPIPIIGALLRDDTSITIAHGNELVLSFENVVLNEYEKVQCLVRKDPRVTTQTKEIKVSKIRTPVTDNNVHYVTPQTSTSGTSSKRKNDGTQEVPMEKRLENLTLNKLDSASKVPKVDNVAQLLVQGLHSKDKTMLRSVLSRRDENVIKNTIKRLPMPVIVPLVQEVTNLIQGKTVSSQIGSLWLKHLVQTHTGLLLSNPELPDLLGPVLGMIENRLSLQMPLNRLRGRLDLLVSQVSTVNSKNALESDDNPLLIYNDKEVSDSESEDMEIAPQSESDNEWVEESSEDDDQERNNEEDEDSDESNDIEML